MTDFTPFTDDTHFSRAISGGLSGAAIPFDKIETDPAANLLPRGPYLGMVTNVRANEPKKRAEFEVDVAEGPNKDFFKLHPGAPAYAHTLYLSYETSRLARLKLDLGVIATYNPSYDPFGGWNRDSRSFVGKRIGFTVSYRAKRDSRGEVTLMPSYHLIPADAMASGDYLIPGDVALDGTRGEDTPGTPLAFPADDSAGDPDDELWGDPDE